MEVLRSLGIYIFASLSSVLVEEPFPLSPTRRKHPRLPSRQEAAVYYHTTKSDPFAGF